MDILAAIHKLANMWKAVKLAMIAQCFKHAGFCASEEPVAVDLDSMTNGTDSVDGGWT